MIHHISLAARNPQHVPAVLAEIMHGQTSPAPPNFPRAPQRVRLNNFQGNRSWLFLALWFALFSSQLAAQNFVYTNNNLPGPNSVSGFSVSPAGTLTPLPGSPFLTGGTGNNIGFGASNRAAVSALGGFLFVINQTNLPGSHTVSVFSINPVTGALTPVPGQPFATNGAADYAGSSLACTPDGKFLYVGHSAGNFTVFSIAANGVLTPIAGSPFLSGGTLVNGMKVTPNGKFLAAAIRVGPVDRLAIFSIAASGAIAPVPGSPFQVLPFGAAGIESSADGTRLFVAQFSAAIQTRVSVFNLAPNGVPALVAGSPFTAPGLNSNTCLLSRDGKFLFVGNQDNLTANGTFTVFNVAANGSLSEIAGSPFANPGGRQPQQMAQNRAGTLLYANNDNGTVSVFNIAATGALSAVAGAPFAAGSALRPGLAAYPISAPCTALTLLPAALDNGTVGTPYNQNIVVPVSDGDPTFSVTSGALPLGLSLDAATGAITGTPAQAGTFSFFISAVSASGLCNGFRSYTITITCPAATLTAPPLPTATAAQAYSTTLTVTTGGPYTFALTQGNLPSGLTLNNSTGAITGLPTVVGVSTFAVTATAPSGCTVSASYTLNVVCPPAISLSALANGSLGVTYNQSITASPAGGNYSYAVTSGSLPPGLSLNGTTGTLTGTPSLAGTFGFVITATGFGSCSGSFAYSVTISGPVCGTVSLPALSNGLAGVFYIGSLAGTTPAGSYTFAVTAGNLPPGLVLQPLTGMIYGTPSLAGTFNFTITATDAGGCTGNRAYSVLIQ